MIEVNNLEKSFDDVQVLKGISTTFEEGKTSLIIGSSGAGKTVFFKCLLGLFEPTGGEIIYDGDNSANDTKESKQERRKNIGTVFQYSALLDFLTVEENVMFPLEMFSDLSRSEMMDRAHEVLKRVNLKEESFKQYPAEISGGMQKRVAIARAVVTRPKYLFCDEPNSGLDPATATVIDNLIQDLTKEYNITTVINSHDMNSVIEIGEKIIFLSKGLKAWEGTNQEILHTEQEDVFNFVYNSDLMKKVREALIREGK
ncbi:ATP-binding cassette domain-containing protein [Weeksellaceae bacterium KMM 9713]|uniref:ATP-binding cassette domain-containing protein n=1 Tax=Profundicola chukchiensis TaxID=2961959 RepID=A0A9X4RW63_9FLAO|nr:ATP-binding cassette domain-containing protein [Profundicola chukchiensis]MDG4945492.1 ATP-binding cassette domain-containing protein [Profundicola chukchiensis]MDG4949572.1 ATP-binding cassette domain-containing protein [Profundicola chukchiensis]